MDIVEIGDIKNRLSEFDPTEMRERLDTAQRELLNAEATYKRALISKTLEIKYSEKPCLSDKIAEMKAYIHPDVEALEALRIKAYGDLKVTQRHLEECFKLHDRDKKLADLEKSIIMKFRED